MSHSDGARSARGPADRSEPGNATDDNGPGLDAAMVIQNYLPAVGGAERQLASLVPLMLDRGIVPTIYTRSRPGLPAEEWIGGARVVRVATRGPKPSRAVMFVVGTLWRLFRTRPDVVHAYDTLTPSLIAGLHRLATGTPYLTKLLRSGELGDLQRLSERPLGALRLRLLRSSVDRFVAISRDLEDELAERGIDADRLVFIPNGVDTERFSPPVLASGNGAAEGVDRTGSREWLRLRAGVLPDWPEAPVVLIVGRIQPEKRVVELARQWSRVRVRHPDACLYVVGEGPLESQLTGIDGVRTLGKREDVPLLLRWSDLYVSASSAEGLSNALLEAMASGCPCVVTDVGGVADVMTSGIDGRVVGPGPGPDAVERLVDEVIDLLGDRETAAELGRAARKTVQGRYSIEQTADRLAAQYRKLSAGGGRRSGGRWRDGRWRDGRWSDGRPNGRWTRSRRWGLGRGRDEGTS